MSRADSLFATGVSTLVDQLGTSVIYTAPGGVAAAKKAIVSEKKEDEEETEIGTMRVLTAVLRIPKTEIASVHPRGTFVLDELTYAYDTTLQDTESFSVVRVIHRMPYEASRENYRRR